MHYFIDGYNLLFRVARAGGDLQKQRQEIIQDLEAKVNALELEVTLVFDAQYQPNESSRAHLHRLEIYFTNLGETADEFILHALKEDTKPHLQTVVTSDKKLAWLARRRHAHTETIEDFVSWLNRRYNNKLRTKKTPKKLIPSISSSKAAPASSPHLESSPEECFNFYLAQFEQSYAFLADEKSAKKAAKKANKGSPSASKKKLKNAPKLVEDEQSLLERWLSAFQRDPNISD